MARGTVCGKKVDLVPCFFPLLEPPEKSEELGEAKVEVEESGQVVGVPADKVGVVGRPGGGAVVPVVVVGVVVVVVVVVEVVVELLVLLLPPKVLPPRRHHRVQLVGVGV